MRTIQTEEQIDAALDSVLKAAGSALRHYSMAKTRKELRESMRKIMADSYTAGLNALIDKD